MGLSPTPSFFKSSPVPADSLTLLHRESPIDGFFLSKLPAAPTGGGTSRAAAGTGDDPLGNSWAPLSPPPPPPPSIDPVTALPAEGGGAGVALAAASSSATPPSPSSPSLEVARGDPVRDDVDECGSEAGACGAGRPPALPPPPPALPAASPAASPPPVAASLTAGSWGVEGLTRDLAGDFGTGEPALEGVAGGDVAVSRATVGRSSGEAAGEAATGVDTSRAAGATRGELAVLSVLLTWRRCAARPPAGA